MFLQILAQFGALTVCANVRCKDKAETMYAIIGITGQIGGIIGRTLIDAKRPVRAVVRSIDKGREWAERGCQLALANIEDADALAAAFRGAEAVFILVPPNFDPLPDFPEARAIGAALRSALEAAHPGRALYLSTIGAQASQINLLTQHSLIEQAIRGVATPLAILRPAWFMENCSWDVAPARERGVIPSFLQPLDRPFPMVATADIGRVAAEILQEHWSGHRLVELEGPKRVTPNEIAASFARLLGRPVTAEVVARTTWESLFKSQGMRNPGARIRMLDGFNEGWIEFDRGEAGSRKGIVALEAVLKVLLERQSAK
jgi:NAD(P)H dehydrogenase (quinone)